MKTVNKKWLAWILAFTMVLGCCTNGGIVEAEENGDNDMEYTVTYDANGGTGSMDPMKVTTGSAVKLLDNGFTAPEGKKFKGWAIGSPDSGTILQAGEEYTFTGNTIVYAVWVPAEYTVTYDANGGTGSMDPMKVTTGSAVKLLDNGFTAPEGKKFRGWAIGSPDSGTVLQAGEEYTFTGDTTVYAVWVPEEYTVMYDANGGTGSMDPMKVTAGSAVRLLDNRFATPEGKKFKGWAIGSPDSGTVLQAGEEYTFTGDTTVYAVWVPEEYTVMYDANGGTGSMDPMKVTAGSAVRLLDNGFIAPKGKKFKGWAIGSPDSGKVFQAGEEYTFTGDMTVYAVWVPAEYTVTYDVDGGTMPSTYPGQYETGKELSEAEMPVPTKEGYLFGGWYSGNTRYAGIAASVSGDLKLTAKWYAITLICDAKNGYAAVGEALSLNADIDATIKNHCRFVWEHEGEEREGAKVSFDVSGAGDQVYYCTVSYGIYSQRVKITAIGYNAKIKITLYKTKNTKDIFGKEVSLEAISLAKKKDKKYITLNKKKGTIKIKKYRKSTKINLTVNGQKLTVTVTAQLPIPKVKAKRGRVTSYVIGKYRRFKLVYSNMKGADRIVSYYSKKKNSRYKKGGKSQNKKKGATISIPKGSKYYFKVVVYYGKAKSPQSKAVLLKG